MTRIVLDTCVLIDFLRGKAEAIQFLADLPQIPFLSALTVAELYAGVREGQERTSLDQLVDAFHVVPVSETIGRQGGLYRRQYHGSHGVGLIDAVIAATSETLGAELITSNTKHFPMLSRIKAPY